LTDPGSGATSAERAVKSSVELFRLWEPHIRAFAWMDPTVALECAQAADRDPSSHRRRLHGIPVGIKDIFDTSGIPTEYGSPIFHGRIPNSTASAVSRLEAAGAVVLGKTVTAELAYFAPGPTRNPWDLARTPGGSSMGSAASVAARIVPAAIGSQTNGSIIRPAAFCGVVGFKPTGGLIPTDGVLRISSTLDQVGVLAQDVTTAARIAATMAGPTTSWKVTELRQPPILAAVRTPEWAQVDDYAQSHWESIVAAAMAAGALVTNLDLSPMLANAVPIHHQVLAAEAHRNVFPLVSEQMDLCSPEIVSLLSAGASVSELEYEHALRVRRATVVEFDRWIRRFDAVLTLAAFGQAGSPETTGDPGPCTRWTLVGAPAISVPTGLSPNRMPLGVQLVGARGSDAKVLNIAKWLQSLCPVLLGPKVPTY